MFKYSLQKSYNELVTSYSEALKGEDGQYYLDEVNFRVGTYLHWLISTWERIDKNQFTDNDRMLLSALKYVYNAIKHNSHIISVSKRKQGGMTFPFSFPLVIPATQFFWNDIPCYGRNKNQHDNYNNTLKGMDVLDTLRKANDIIATINEDRSE